MRGKLIPVGLNELFGSDSTLTSRAAIQLNGLPIHDDDSNRASPRHSTLKETQSAATLITGNSADQHGGS
jgi:hypothetical protein